MDAMTFGYFLMTLVVLAFVATFYNFQGRARRQLFEYETNARRLTDDLKKTQREREKEQAIFETQALLIADAEDRIRQLERNVVRLEEVAARLEGLDRRFDELAGRV